MSAARIEQNGIIEQLPPALQKLAAFERFHLRHVDVLQYKPRDPYFDTRYLPQHCGAFKLPCFWIQRRHMHVYGGQPAADDDLCVVSGSGWRDRVLFPIHPTCIAAYRDFLADVRAVAVENEGPCIWAVPTSSTRTLLAWPDQDPDKAIFMKTTLHSNLLGDRRVYLRSAGCSVGLSQLINSASPLPQGLQCLAEPLSVVPRRMPDSGALFRLLPAGVGANERTVAPLFALAGGRESSRPLLVSLAESHGVDPAGFVEEVLCAQFARVWLSAYADQGLILEAHGQNFLLPLTLELSPLNGFVYRDLEGASVDWTLRRSRGLLAPDLLPHSWAWRETYETKGWSYGEPVWNKLRIALLQYLRMFLDDLDQALVQWQQRRMIAATTFSRDDATRLFSKHIMQAVEEIFGARGTAEDSIQAGDERVVYRSVTRFVSFLMRVRKQALSAN